jgi:esterase
MGHSMGGKAAMHLAFTRPSRVRRLVVADVAPVIYSSDATTGHAHLLRAMLALPLAQVAVFLVCLLFSSSSVLQVASAEDAKLLLAPDVPDAAMRDFLLTNLSFETPAAPQWKPPLSILLAALGEVRGSPEYANDRFEGETLFVSGGASRYVLPEHRARICHLFPRAHFAAIPGAGHWLHADKPREFLDIVAAFLKQ